MKEISIRLSAMSNSSSHRFATKHFLIHHKLSIILTKGSRGFLKVRLRQIGAFGPLPSATPSKLALCHFPLKLSRQSTPLPIGIRSEEHTSELQSRGHLVCR